MRDEHGEVISTDRFLSGMDADQLIYCAQRANELLERKRNEARKTIWQVVEDRSLVVAHFREDEYLNAVDCLARTARKEFEDGETNHYSLERIRVPASEYEAYFAERITAHLGAEQ